MFLVQLWIVWNLLASLIVSNLFAGDLLDPEALVKKMEASYAQVNDYQANVEVRTQLKDGSVETKKFMYSYKKPKWIRLDFESPHHGMALVYPDKNGKVLVHRVINLHLDLDSPLLQIQSGQRLNQTDLGLLIRNISNSLGEHRKGPVKITDEGAEIHIHVLAEDHFRKGVVTLYDFIIDKSLWLPMEVKESTPDGHLERVMTFHHLKTNLGIPASFFQLNGS